MTYFKKSEYKYLLKIQKLRKKKKAKQHKKCQTEGFFKTTFCLKCEKNAKLLKFEKKRIKIRAKISSQTLKGIG